MDITGYYSYTPIGSSYLMVAANESGITHIDLLSQQQLEYYRSLRRDDNKVKPWLELVRAYLYGETSQLSSLPIQVARLSGSDFYHAVWQYLLRIPRGGTMTYQQIAKRLGNANKARAVGMACASNPVVVAIPCHRVVAKNGLGGYRWGLDWKRKLLSLEGASLS